jgi:hypothetical protein
MTPDPYIAWLRRACDEAILAHRYAEAATLLGLIIGAGGDDGVNLYHLGHVQYERGDYVAAEAALRRAVMIDPGRPEAFNDLGAALFRLGRDAEALTFIRQALRLDPNMAEAEESDSIWLLRYGRFREGWRKYEARKRTSQGMPTQRQFAQPQWRGEPIHDRTILLHAEQGFGDAIQFARYAPLVAARGAKVILEVHPGLATALRTLPGVSRLIEHGVALPPFDLHCPLLSLPLAFDTDLDSIPASVPYVMPDPERVFAWRNRLGPRRVPRIGIAWSGNPHHREDRRRSIPLAAMADLLRDRTDREFHVVQNEIRHADRVTLGGLAHVRDHAGLLRDFADTAALVSLLDVVITVDTAVAHLAGAMGWPVWVMLASVPDWRWMLQRDDSPWYPSMWLFRQQRRDEWGPVLEEVARQLDDMLT